MHTAPYAYSSGRSSMRALPPHIAPTGDVCVSDLRIKLPVTCSCMRRYGAYNKANFTG